MIEDIKSSALAFLYAWGIILVPVFTVAYVVQYTNPPVQEV